MSPDRATVEKRLQELFRIVALLRKHETVTQATLQSDPERTLLVEHELQVAIQCVLDVANHLLAPRGGSMPDTYAGVLKALGTHGIVPPEFAKRIEGMAGLRNVIVHLYLEVDPARLVEALQQLDDFEEFARHAVAALDRSQ